MKKKLYVAAILLFAVLFLVSGFFLIRYYVQINRSEKVYQELSQIKQEALVQAEEKAPVSDSGGKQEHHKYQIVSVFTIASSEDSDFPYHLFVDAGDDGEFDRFVTSAKAYSLYETGVTAQPGDKLITLSTCEGYGNLGRLVVVAKRVA